MKTQRHPTGRCDSLTLRLATSLKLCHLIPDFTFCCQTMLLPQTKENAKSTCHEGYHLKGICTSCTRGEVTFLESIVALHADARRLVLQIPQRRLVVRAERAHHLRFEKRAISNASQNPNKKTFQHGHALKLNHGYVGVHTPVSAGKQKGGGGTRVCFAQHYERTVMVAWRHKSRTLASHARTQPCLEGSP